VATAREILLDEVLGLVKEQEIEHGGAQLKVVLANYRVQEKIQKKKQGLIARDALFEDIMAVLAGEHGVSGALAEVLNEYRVQQKNSNSTKTNRNKGVEGRLKHPVAGTERDVAKTRALAAATLTPGSSVGLKNEPIAGGPPLKPRVRGSCPKCHGQSVTSAPAASEYYVYCYLCGWRRYFTGLEGDIKSSLGKEIFSRVFDGDDHK